MSNLDEYVAILNRIKKSAQRDFDDPAPPPPPQTIAAIPGLRNLRTRLKTMGGFNQQDRMIFDKKRSLDRSLMYSYQGADIRKVACSDDFFDDKLHKFSDYIPAEDDYARALINPNKLKQDYDDKILSVSKEEFFHTGDVFEWLGTKTYWLIYLQDLTELAYFRGDIRKCSYIIAWEDEDGEHETYAAIRGPVETKIDYIQKHKISVDNPNYSLHILMPKTTDTVNYFKRYNKFYISNTNHEVDTVCWRVEATDWISTPGILELTAVEYYSNEFEDDLEKGIAGGLKMEPIDPNSTSEQVVELILGETFIKPKVSYHYTWNGVKNAGTWQIDKKYPVSYTIDEDGNGITIKWMAPHSGSFDLFYGTDSKKIVIESLF